MHRHVSLHFTCRCDGTGSTGSILTPSSTCTIIWHIFTPHASTRITAFHLYMKTFTIFFKTCTSPTFTSHLMLHSYSHSHSTTTTFRPIHSSFATTTTCQSLQLHLFKFRFKGSGISQHDGL